MWMALGTETEATLGEEDRGGVSDEKGRERRRRQWRLRRCWGRRTEAASAMRKAEGGGRGRGDRGRRRWRGAVVPRSKEEGGSQGWHGRRRHWSREDRGGRGRPRRC